MNWPSNEEIEQTNQAVLVFINQVLNSSLTQETCQELFHQAMAFNPNHLTEPYALKLDETKRMLDSKINNNVS